MLYKLSGNTSNMETCDYIIEKYKIVDAFTQKIKIWEDDFISGKFNLVSAGLRNFLPNIDYSEHEEIFKNILFHQRLSHLEQAYQQALDCVTCENLTNDTWKLLKKGGGIICTFHTGSYRIINQVLVKYKIPFTLVIAKSILESQGNQFIDLFRLFANDHDEGSFGLIDAESPSSGLQMLREIKKGRSLVLYIDGNTGAGNNDDEKNNLCDIQFLSQRIFARKGIAFLAHIAKAPILTIASYRKSIDDIRLHFFDPIFPGEDHDREAFSKNATQKIYDLVAPIIAEYPEQWEAWMYLHKVANIVNSADTIDRSIAEVRDDANLMLNLTEFGVLKLLDNFYLFKKRGYTSFSIDKDLYGFLHGSISEPVMKKQMGDALFLQLYRKNVLITA
jgi:lauroyl/myristoyl acyltransferase